MTGRRVPPLVVTWLPYTLDMVASEAAVRTKAVLRALEQSWDAATSADPAWSTLVPSRGQCAVSALVVQDEFGGNLVRAIVDGVSHYWNRLADGSEIDATRAQLPHWHPVDEVVRPRSYVLSFPDTLRRYSILRSRIDAVLKVDA